MEQEAHQKYRNFRFYFDSENILDWMEIIADSNQSLLLGFDDWSRWYKFVNLVFLNPKKTFFILGYYIENPDFLLIVLHQEQIKGFQDEAHIVLVDKLDKKMVQFLEVLCFAFYCLWIPT